VAFSSARHRGILNKTTSNIPCIFVNEILRPNFWSAPRFVQDQSHTSLVAVGLGVKASTRGLAVPIRDDLVNGGAGSAING